MRLAARSAWAATCPPYRLSPGLAVVAVATAEQVPVELFEVHQARQVVDVAVGRIGEGHVGEPGTPARPDHPAGRSILR